MYMHVWPQRAHVLLILNYKLQSLDKTGMTLSWAAAAFSFANTPLFEMS